MKKQVELKAKKPILAYVGMDNKTLVESVPTQVIEIVYPSKAEKKDEDTLFSKGEFQEKVEKLEDLPKNRLIWTNDNLVALKTLLDEKDAVSGEYKYRNKIDLIYIDPPFMVQDDFVAQNSIDIDVDEEEDVVSVKEPTIIETIAYKDTWQNGLDSFLQMMRERLELMKDLLAPTGSIYVHLDWHVQHYVKILMDEIFDYNLFKNEIIWQYQGAWVEPKNYFPRRNQQLLFYTKTDNYYFQRTTEEAITEKGVIKRWERFIKNGKIYADNAPYSDGKFLPYLNKFEKENGRKPEGKEIIAEFQGQTVGDVWYISTVNPISPENTSYPTQKPVELLNRIILSSCPKNGIVLDAFMGSGTSCEAAELLSEELNCTWIGIDNSKFAIHTARKRLIELNGKPKEEKGEGIFKVRPFTVENMGYYQRGVNWDPIQVGKQADAYRQAIIELFGGEYSPYSKLLHGKKRGSWIHVGPLSTPIITKQIEAIAEEVESTDFKKCYVLSADFTAHLNSAIKQAKEKYGVQITAHIIPASAIEEIKKRLSLIKQGIKNPEKTGEMSNIAFFSPLTIKIQKVIDGKEVMIELSGLEVDTESFLESQKPERRDELKKWLKKEKSWQSFVDFWAIDWDYESIKDELKEPVFENEWQSFRKRKGKSVVEDLIFKSFHTYEKPGEYTIAAKVTDVFGNDGIVTTKIVIK